MDKKAIFHLESRDVLNIGPKATKTKSITKARTGIINNRRRKVENIRGPPEITRERALRRVRTRLNEWYNRVYSAYEKAWEKLAGVPPDDDEENLTDALMDFEPSDIEIALVLLLFEEKGWSVTHFRNGDSKPTDELPEWELWFKLIMDNITDPDAWVYGKVIPEVLYEALKTFIRRTMTNFKTPRKYDVQTLLEASRMLTVIANFRFETQDSDIYFEEDADGIFNEFKDYLSELQEVIESVELTLNKLKDIIISTYREELDAQSKGEGANFKKVWTMMWEMTDKKYGVLNTVFERNDPRLWVFNAIEKYIPYDDWAGYHDTEPGQLEKMWDLFISNVLDNAKDKKLKVMVRISTIVENLLRTAESIPVDFL